MEKKDTLPLLNFIMFYSGEIKDTWYVEVENTVNLRAQVYN